MRRSKNFDATIFVIFAILIVSGFVILSSASSDLGKSRFDDAYYYLSHQALFGLTLGAAGFLFGLFFPYEKYRKISFIILLVSLGMLILTFTPLAVSLGGASRWVKAGPLTFQPSEILKFAFILYVAAWLSGGKRERQKNFSQGFASFSIICGIIALILLVQKSTSSVAIIMGSALAVYFASGARIKYVFSLILCGILALALFIVITPYRLERIETFINPSDSSGASYQINRALITIGSGGITGLGYGNSQSKAYLPERIGDSIFAIVAEEFGFIGATALILIFAFLVLRCYIIAQNLTDPFGKLVLIGFASIIGIQAFMHVGAISGLIPLTGVPLPFISYGGTALAVFMTAAGVMLNITKRG